MHKTVTGTLVLLVAASAAWLAILTREIIQLERQLEPVLEQQAIEDHQEAPQQSFLKRLAQDRQRYSQDQLREAEQLYPVDNQKWGTPEAVESLQTMFRNIPTLAADGLRRTVSGRYVPRG